MFCLDSGFTTIEKKILDISMRKGTYDNSLEYFNSVIALKDRLEYRMGCYLYSLFPEISNDDILFVFQDRTKLTSLFEKR